MLLAQERRLLRLLCVPVIGSYPTHRSFMPHWRALCSFRALTLGGEPHLPKTELPCAFAILVDCPLDALTERIFATLSPPPPEEVQVDRAKP